jgi:hypothetical protein
MRKEILAHRQDELLEILKLRFEKNMNRHEGIKWIDVQQKLQANPNKIWSLNEMENSGGEPDLIISEMNDEYAFYDCSAESPKGRRSFCYDRAALDSRKENKPANTAIEMAISMGVDILSEVQYRHLQKFGNFDTKTSSWLFTPPEIRKLGGAVFGDWRYGRVFLYHNGAESYYAARGFRGLLKL